MQGLPCDCQVGSEQLKSPRGGIERERSQCAGGAVLPHREAVRQLKQDSTGAQHTVHVTPVLENPDPYMPNQIPRVLPVCPCSEPAEHECDTFALMGYQ